MRSAVAHADLVFLSVHRDVAVALDFAADLDGLPGGEPGVPAAATDRGLGGFRADLAGAAHREEARFWGSRDATVRSTWPSRKQVVAVQVSLDSEGASAWPCFKVSDCRPATMITAPPGENRTSNSTAALRGTGAGDGVTIARVRSG